jgi:hypothetical protein
MISLNTDPISLVSCLWQVLQSDLAIVFRPKSEPDSPPVGSVPILVIVVSASEFLDFAPWFTEVKLWLPPASFFEELLLHPAMAIAMKTQKYLFINKAFN